MHILISRSLRFVSLAMAAKPKGGDFIVDMYHIEREGLSKPVGKASKPNVTLASGIRDDMSPDSHVTRSYVQASDKHVGFRVDFTEYRTGYVRDHSTPYRNRNPQEYHGDSDVEPLRWDYHDLDFRPPENIHPPNFQLARGHSAYTGLDFRP